MAKKRSTSNCANPTARSLAELRKRGYLAEKVEQRVPMGGGATFSRDLFGIGDILAVRGETLCLFGGPNPPDVLLVQATSGANHSKRVLKSLTEAAVKLRVVLSAGLRFEVWSWSLTGERGKRKTYTLRRQEITVRELH